MPHLIIVILVIAAAFWGSNLLAGLAPAAKERAMRRVGGYVALGAATFLLLRGQTEVALGLGGFGLYLLGFSGTPHWSGLFKQAGAPADLRSSMVAMEPDFRSGAAVSGMFAGKNLGDLSRDQCEAFYRSAIVADPPGARLLELYFDRRFPGWRGANNQNADAGGRARSSGQMTEDEAYEILGLAKGASQDDIARVHRALMKKLHPDQGGTTSLAAKVNEARDMLTRRHG